MSTFIGTFTDPSNTVASQREKRIAASRREWPEYPAKDLEPVGPYVCDKGSGNLFLPTQGAVLPGDAFGYGPKVDGFYIAASGEPIYLTRSESPSTLEELRAQEKARADAQREREQAHRAFVTSQPRRTLRLCDFGPDWEMPTVSEAARLLLDHGCTLENQDGHLLVEIPEQLDPSGNLHLEAMKHVVRAARVLDAAGHVVLDAIEKGGKTSLVDRLPDRHAAAFGGVARAPQPH